MNKIDENPSFDVELVQTIWSKKWFDIKNRLEKMNDDFISLNKFIMICEDEWIREEKTQILLIKYFNDLGMAIHFNDFELNDTHILNPRWLTKAVYAIITSEILIENSGILNLNLVTKILQNEVMNGKYPQNKNRYIVGLMKKF